MKKAAALLIAVSCLAGCAAGTKTLVQTQKDVTIAVVPFEDCEPSSVNNCKDSGALAAKIYGQVLGAPVLTSEADPAAKLYDLLVTGKVTHYNIGTPMVGRVNFAAVNVAVKRSADGVVVVTQEERNDASPTYGKKTHELVQEFAEDLKQVLR